MSIILNDNIEVRAPKPIDSRTSLSTIAERDAIPLYYRYNGMPVWVDETSSNYRWYNNTWNLEDNSINIIPTGLEKITEGSNTGWRLIGANPAYYGNIGNNAVDLSISSGASTTKGAIGNNSLAEGSETKANGAYSHAEGNITTATGIASHSEGSTTIAIGHYSHTEGLNTISTGEGAHSEGLQSTASGNYAHSEGNATIASGDASHSQNALTTASGEASHSGGIGTSSFKVIASGKASFNHSEVTTSKLGAAAANSAILGGIDNQIDSSYTGSIILGGNGITATQSWTTYVEHIMLNARSAFPASPEPGTIFNHVDSGNHSLWYYNGTDWELLRLVPGDFVFEDSFMYTGPFSQFLGGVETLSATGGGTVDVFSFGKHPVTNAAGYPVTLMYDGSIINLHPKMAINKEYADETYSKIGKLPVYSSAPTSPEEGDIYYDTTLKHAFVWGGTQWEQL